MATTDDKRSAIMNLAEEIRKSKAAQKSESSLGDPKELSSLINELKKQKAENTVSAKFMKSVTKKLDTASNPTTYLRAVIPQIFKTFHENLDNLDKQRAAQQKLDKIEREIRSKELDKVVRGLNEIINNDKSLTETLKKYGQNAAMQAALVLEESKATRKAEEEFVKNMAGITQRLGTIGDDARAQWMKNKGITPVKIVEDEPSKEELEKIAAALSEQIETDARQYDTERIEKKKVATDERRNKENMLKEQRSLRSLLFGKKKEEKKEGGGFFDGLLNMFSGFFSGGSQAFFTTIFDKLFKAGLGVLIFTGIKEYFTNPEFKEKVDKMVEDVYNKYIDPMWQGFKTWFLQKWEEWWPQIKESMTKLFMEHWDKILVGLAFAFPGATLTLIGTALGTLWAVLKATAAKIASIVWRAPGGAPLPDAGVPDDGPDKGKPKGQPKPKETPKTKTPPSKGGGKYKWLSQAFGKTVEWGKGALNLGKGAISKLGSSAVVRGGAAASRLAMGAMMSNPVGWLVNAGLIGYSLYEMSSEAQARELEEEAEAASQGPEALMAYYNAKSQMWDSEHAGDIDAFLTNPYDEKMAKLKELQKNFPGATVGADKSGPYATPSKMSLPALNNPNLAPMAVNPNFAAATGAPLIVAPSTNTNTTYNSNIFPTRPYDASRSILYNR